MEQPRLTTEAVYAFAGVDEPTTLDKPEGLKGVENAAANAPQVCVSPAHPAFSLRCAGNGGCRALHACVCVAMNACTSCNADCSVEVHSGWRRLGSADAYLLKSCLPCAEIVERYLQIRTRRVLIAAIASAMIVAAVVGAVVGTQLYGNAGMFELEKMPDRKAHAAKMGYGADMVICHLSQQSGLYFEISIATAAWPKVSYMLQISGQRVEDDSNDERRMSCK